MVAVGDSTEIELIFTSSKGGYGIATSKSATVTCNDNDRGSFPLTLKAKVYQYPDSLAPLSLSASSFTYESKTRSNEVKLKVKNVSKNKVKMTLASCPYGFLKVNVPDSELKPGKEKEIKIKIDPTLKDEEFKKSFTLAVNDSLGTRYTVPVVLFKTAPPPSIQPPPGESKKVPLQTAPVPQPVDSTKKSK